MGAIEFFRIKLKAIVFGAGMAMALLITACGGGGGGSESSEGFEESQLSGQAVYLVDDNGAPSYELAVFNADGTGFTSDAVQFGAPLADESFAWSIDGEGRLRIVDDGEVILVTLLRHDKENRYLSIKAEASGRTVYGGIYYDQATGFAQAQQYVAARLPDSGTDGIPDQNNGSENIPPGGGVIEIPNAEQPQMPSNEPSPNTPQVVNDQETFATGA